MDVREKLVEILKQAPFEGKVLDEWWWEEKIKRIADHLISSGVTVQENVKMSDELLKQLKNAPITICKEEPSIATVQEWISVKDRLPKIPDGYAESPEPVLYMMKNTKIIYTGYYGEGGVWRDKYFRQYSDIHEGVDANDVLYWMWQHDLPKPPKGE